MDIVPMLDSLIRIVYGQVEFRYPLDSSRLCFLFTGRDSFLPNVAVVEYFAKNHGKELSAVCGCSLLLQTKRTCRSESERTGQCE
jgi:hypothetical protein